MKLRKQVRISFHTNALGKDMNVPVLCPLIKYFVNVITPLLTTNESVLVSNGQANLL